ncbi:hypothetical protein BCU70_15610 [Vibrio sp. 10N.286.49.C2]|uniref:hypothetical protein n=1 Tax=unclassified Vibrio TaxID=2614977 RepID=UPI000C85A149|nr:MULTISPECIES: hypothetical protein [unclassified Vibrio]PMH37324.1 hypothetical protein BCU70_15610 [Vibrio sp. 10N.286.49.C2]PMH49412.1 hypothetical protein BCU66_20275 [Vibrio sp. 10N.286.49.B1]PMH83903.1 hypothetical protein BCU58_13300 [Vibrio sp. 10N.286.48.B7]
MAKRLCKFNRHEISANLGDIHRLVAEPKFLCRSCSRSSSDRSTLCKPAAIPPVSCQEKPVEEKIKCGLLLESIKPEGIISKQTVLEKQSEAQVVMFHEPESLNKKALKRASKALKKQTKMQKKLQKIIRKSQKLARKQSKLEQKYHLAEVVADKQLEKVQPEQLH